MLNLPEVKSFSRIALGINEKCKLCMYFHRRVTNLELISPPRMGGGGMISSFIMHCTHYLSSHWLLEPTVNFGNQSNLQIS